MKTSLPQFLRVALVVGGLALSFNAVSAGELKPVTATAEQIAAYPLKTCLVSEEELGSMGKPVDYVYQEEGKPDRLVRFCCKGCLKDFKKEPEKYLKQIDEAAAKAPKKS